MHLDANDVMQVCRNGHVLTEQLRTDPFAGSDHCDRCGATALHHCETCGSELAGAPRLRNFAPIGRREPPQFCAHCGAPFPWANARRYTPPPGSLAQLEKLLRRLPFIIRQLRSRHADRPPFQVRDQRDLEDLVRSVLPLHFDVIRSELRTPNYAASSQMDFVLWPVNIALVLKFAEARTREQQLGEQLREDLAHYQVRKPKTLVVFVYDPETVLRDPEQLASAWSQLGSEFRLHCVIAG